MQARSNSFWDKDLQRQPEPLRLYLLPSYAKCASIGGAGTLTAAFRQKKLQQLRNATFVEGICLQVSERQGLEPEEIVPVCSMKDF